MLTSSGNPQISLTVTVDFYTGRMEMNMACTHFCVGPHVWLKGALTISFRHYLNPPFFK